MKNNIQEPYCSFEVSKLLKEKGFNVLCPQGYDSSELDYQRFELPKGLQFGICSNNSPNPNHFTAPTHALAIEWVRVNFGIWITADCASTDFWFPKIIKTLDGSFAVHTVEITYPKGKFDTPQEATEAGLLYTLQKLIP